LLKAGDEEFLALVNHKVAKSIFLHVLAPRDTKYFTADALKTLAPVTIVDPTTGEEQATRYCTHTHLIEEVFNNFVFLNIVKRNLR